MAVWRDVLRDSGLPTMAKVTGYVLNTYMSAGGYAFPSVETLARGASVSDRTVHKSIAQLEAAGFLLVERSRNRGGNRYQAVLPGTANELRRSEWRNGEPHARNGEPPSGESVEDAESSATRPADADAPHAIKEFCLDCAAIFTTADVNASRCPDCAEKAAAA